MIRHTALVLFAGLALGACQSTETSTPATSAASASTTADATETAAIASGLSCDEYRVIYRNALQTMSSIENDVKARQGIPATQQTQGLTAEHGTPEEKADAERATARAGQAIIEANKISCLL